MESQTYSGIQVLGTMHWGTHFCQFYNTKQDLLEILVPYFKTGLENNEFCLWITSDPIDVNGATHALEKEIPEFNNYIIQHKIEIVQYEAWYLQEGSFKLEVVLSRWYKKLAESIENGFTGMRVNGISEWLTDEVRKNCVFCLYARVKARLKKEMHKQALRCTMFNNCV
jgi:hypothetical protein